MAPSAFKDRLQQSYWHFFPVCAKLFQSCCTLCDTTVWSPPGNSVYGILQVSILEWVVMPSSRGSSPPRDPTYASCLLHWQAGSLPLVAPGSCAFQSFHTMTHTGFYFTQSVNLFQQGKFNPFTSIMITNMTEWISTILTFPCILLFKKTSFPFF